MEQVEPVQAQLKPEDKRRALFAAAGERIYYMEKSQLELNAIRDELSKLDKEHPVSPPKIPAPELPPAPAPAKEKKRSRSKG